MVPTDQGERDQEADEGGGRSGKKLCSAVADAATGRPRRARMSSLELTFAPKDASGEGDTCTEDVRWSGGVAGDCSLLELHELLEESPWEGVTKEAEVEAGVSSKLRVTELGTRGRCRESETNCRDWCPTS